MRYTLDENDYLAFCNYYYAKTRAGRAGIHRMYIIGAALFIFFAYSEYSDPVYGAHNPAYYTAYLAVSALVLGLLYFVYLHWVRTGIIRMAARGGGMQKMLGEQELDWDREEVRVSTPGGRGKIKWRDVQEIAEDKAHFYIIIGSLRAFIVPKGAFASEGEARAAWTEIGDFFGRAHGRSA